MALFLNCCEQSTPINVIFLLSFIWAKTSLISLRDLRPRFSVLNSLTICVILITVYVQPYQEITGTLGAGGGINWLSGESLLVLAGPVVVLPSAWIAWLIIRKSYG